MLSRGRHLEKMLYPKSTSTGHPSQTIDNFDITMELAEYLVLDRFTTASP
jgi:hypothetical protein